MKKSQPGSRQITRESAGSVVRILMWSKFYLNLTLKERHALVKQILDSFPYTVRQKKKGTEGQAAL